MRSSKVLSIKVFLSHKFKAPATNQYFFRLFSQANVQFEVDTGKLSTNVTRLERMIRGADGFVAIYPYDDDGTHEVSDADLLERSQYFRLELELAARSRKPAIVLVDRRFRGIIDVPSNMSHERFDVREIANEGLKPSSPRFVRAFGEFCERVRAASNYDISCGNPSRDSDSVGILLDPRYNPEQLSSVCNAVARLHYKPVTLAWPVSINAAWISHINTFNWMAVDVGPASMDTGIPGLLHGAFVPCLRLMKVDNREAAEPRLMPESALYGAVEVGYWKDIARWFDTASLQAVLENRLKTLDAPTRRFSTLDEALDYFQEAAKRKERVFISYSGVDEELTNGLRAAFKEHFQDVFDYRDGQSIRPGRQWLEEISQSLAKSPVCVILLSSTYVKNGNCVHEMNDAIAARDAKSTKLYPIKVRDESFEMPGALASTQYYRLYDYASSEKLVAAIVEDLKSQVSTPRTARRNEAK